MAEENTDETVEVPSEPIQVPAPAESEPVHPTGVVISPDEVQGPTGAVTDEADLPADNTTPPEEEVYELGEQIEPLDEPNGGV